MYNNSMRKWDHLAIDNTINTINMSLNKKPSDRLASLARMIKIKHDGGGRGTMKEEYGSA